MVPVVVRNRPLGWELSMTRLILPRDVAFPESPLPHIGPLSPEDADHVHANSIYQKVMSPDYVRGRIQSGPSAGVRVSGKLVAWLMTQDDGSIGVLHVLDEYRRRGYARDLTVYLVRRLREREKSLFVHIEEGNTSSIDLAVRLGFRKDRRLCWFNIKTVNIRSGADNYC